jgi:hypothetical protein
VSSNEFVNQRFVFSCLQEESDEAYAAETEKQLDALRGLSIAGIRL